MKHTAKLLIPFLLILTMAGCGKNENSSGLVNSGTPVDKVISEQIDNAQPQNSGVSTESGDTEAGGAAGTQERSNVQNSSDVDYDLTNMNSDMVYATVYQMMAEPNAYVGKTMRMDGLYHASCSGPTAQCYHCCIIQDALACCAQGMEFVWDDGSHLYPEEYPDENAEIIVQGTFETYQEEGDTNLYCHLKDASWRLCKAVIE